MYRFYSISTYTLWKMLLNYYCCIWLIKEGKLLGSEYNCKGGACLLVLHGTFWIFGLYMWPWKERHPKLTFPRKEEAASNQEACIFTTIWELTHKAWGKLFSAEKEASALCTALCNPPHTHTTPLLRQHLIYPRLASNLLRSWGWPELLTLLNSGVIEVLHHSQWMQRWGEPSLLDRSERLHKASSLNCY